MRISIVTPAHKTALIYLEEAYASLLSQDLPALWSWEWLVQLDGLDPEEAWTFLPSARSDGHVSIAANRPGGPGVTRNHALSRARGSLIRNLDADDVLMPLALQRDIDVLTRRPNIGWVTSKALDLMPDGTMTGWDYDDPMEGLIRVGSVYDYWVNNNWRLPILPGTLCIRTELIDYLGGWMGLNSSEDTGLIMAANAVSEGFFIGTPSLAYRKHEQQTTAQNHHTDQSEAQLRRDLIVRRFKLLQDLSDNSQAQPRWFRSP